MTADGKDKQNAEEAYVRARRMRNYAIGGILLFLVVLFAGRRLCVSDGHVAMSPDEAMKTPRRLPCGRCSVALPVVVIGMVGLSYAAVPLYYVFCRATGYGGTPSRATAAPGVTMNRIITVRFGASTNKSIPLCRGRSRPSSSSVKVKVGESKLVFFRAVNRSARAIVGHATFNVQPDNAAHYFNKIQCFCFTEQTLQAGQSVEMPVSFFISPRIMKDQDDNSVTEITLSYTFYPSATAKPALTVGRRGERTEGLNDTRKANTMAQGEVHHDYHLVDPSPLPIVSAAGAYQCMFGAVFWMNAGYNAGFFSARRRPAAVA